MDTDTLFEMICGLLRYDHIETVADATGLHPSTLYNWREGKIQTLPRTRTLQKVAAYYGYEEHWA